jgi:hypothetical protein
MNHAVFNLHANENVIYARPSNVITNESRLATLRLSGNFILGRVTYCDLSIVMVDRQKETQMKLAWTFGNLVSPKRHRPDVARYPIIGRWVSNRAAIAIDYAKFSAVHICCLLRKDRLDPRGTSKTSGDFADPPAVCCGSLKALD